MRIMTFPLILGRGKELFTDGIAPAALKLTDSKVGPSGAIAAWYKRGGEVKTGTIGV